jgi:exodeoxyribonuclease VII small subunit
VSTPTWQGTAVSDLSYEQARDALVEVVAKLEGGDVPLEEALSLWELGEALGSRCQEVLDGAEARLSATGDGDEPTEDD